MDVPRWGIVCLALFLASSVPFTGAQTPQPEAPAGTSAPAATPDPAVMPALSVDSGTLQPESVIELTFKQPVAKEADFNKPAEADFIEVQPPLPGRLVWKSERVATYELSAAPLPGTEYTFSLGSSTAVRERTHLPGGVFGKAKSAPLKVERVEAPGTGSSELENRQPEVYCWFTDDVDVDLVAPHGFFVDETGKKIRAVARYGTLAENNRFYKAPKSFTQRYLQRPGTTASGFQPQLTNDLPVGNVLKFTPAEPLTEGHQWEFCLYPGFKAKAGGGALEEVFHRKLGGISVLAGEKMTWYASPGENRYVEVQFNSPLANGDADVAGILKLVEITPPVSDLKASVNWKTLTLKGEFEAKKNYSIKIKPGLKAKNGTALVTEFTKTVEFKPCEASIALPSNETAQFSFGRRKYEVQSVNMKSVRIRVKALNGVDLVRTLQAYDQYTGTTRNDKRLHCPGIVPFELVSGSSVHDEAYSFQDEEIDSLNSVELDWTEMLGAEKPAALFISVDARSRNDLGTDEKSNRIAQALVQITDLGVTWKQDPGGVLLYVFSCRTGEPVGGAEVRMFGEDAKDLSRMVTNEQGVVRLPAAKGVFTIAVHKDSDQYSLIFDDNLPRIPRYRFPIDFTHDPIVKFHNDVSMFTDRYLYRPGETMHLKGIWRERLDTDLQIPSARKVTVSIQDADDKVIFERETKLTELGTFADTFELPPSSVGRFRAIVTLPKPEEKSAEDNGDEATEEDNDRGQSYSFSEDFMVQEFRRNTFEVKVKPPEAPRMAEESQVSVAANYLMGKPLSDGKVAWSMHARPAGFYPERYSGYFFGDHAKYDPYYWYHYFGFRESRRFSDDEDDGKPGDSKTGETTLNPNGPTVIRFPLPKYEFPSRIGVHFNAEVTDANQQTLSESASYEVPSSEFYIGVNRIDSLVRVGDEVPLLFIAVDNAGKPFNKPVKATVAVEHETWATVATETSNGDTATHSESTRKEVFRQEVALNGDAPTRLNYVPGQNGSYYVTVRAKDDSGADVATRVKIDAYGKTDFGWEYEDGARIRLVPDKAEYLPGETARILVQTPVDGCALIAMERSKVGRSFVTMLSATNPVIEVPVTDADAPNVYISVTLIKGAKDNKREVKEPIAKVGYCKVAVRDRADRLAISLKPARDVVRPGMTTGVDGVVTDAKNAPVPNAEVTLWVVDEGVLQVAGYSNPDFLTALLPDVPLGVITGTTLPLFLPEKPDAIEFVNKGFVAGGGGFSDAGKLRVDFNPCPLWVGSLTTDAQGAFRSELKAPDSLTRFRILAVAVAGARQFGNAVSAVTVNKPLMVQPVVPRVAHVGDRLQVKAMVHNTSKIAGEFEVSLDAGMGCPVEGGTGPGRNELAKRISLGVNESRAVPFDVGFDAIGEARWNWRAALLTATGTAAEADKAELVDAVESKFPVYYPLPIFRESAYERVVAGAKDVNILAHLTPELLVGSGELTVEMTPSILTEAADAIEHVLHYPYGCVEQTTSSMAPWFAAKELREYAPAMRKSDAEIKKAIQHGADRLLTMQTASGGLAYWPAGTEACLWGSGYGGMGLLLARENGASVPDEAVEKLLTYLAKTLREAQPDPVHGGWAETRARILYVLALGGKPEPAFVATMLKDAAKFNGSTRALLAMAIVKGGGAKADARKLLELPPATVEDSSDLYFLWHPLDLPMGLMAWCMVDPGSPKVMGYVDRLIRSRTREGHWGSTISNAWSLNALAAYARTVERVRGAVAVDVNGMGVAERFTLSPEKKMKEIRISIAPSAELPKLLVSAQGRGRVFCRVHVVSRPKIVPARELDCGFSIRRKYELVNPKGGTSPVGELHPGDVVLVTLSVHVPVRNEYLAVEDPLPAILEAVNPEFASQAAPDAGELLRTNWYMSHVEYRDDRVAFFADWIPSGWYDLKYLARVTGQGSVLSPPARIEAMYNPEKYGLSGSERFENRPAAAKPTAP